MLKCRVGNLGGTWGSQAGRCIPISSQQAAAQATSTCTHFYGLGRFHGLPFDMLAQDCKLQAPSHCTYRQLRMLYCYIAQLYMCKLANAALLNITHSIRAKCWPASAWSSLTSPTSDPGGAGKGAGKGDSAVSGAQPGNVAEQLPATRTQD